MGIIIDPYKMGYPTDAFVMKWSVSASQTITLPTPTTPYNYVVDWGDGSSETVTTANKQHTYTTAGTKIIQITGSMPIFGFNNGGDKLYITGLIQFGNVGLTSLSGGFYGCANLTGSIPSGLENQTGLTTIYRAWQNCTGLTGSVPDISGLTSLTTIGYAWSGCTGLTGSIPDISMLTSLDSIRYAWFNCTGLTGSIPDISGLTDLTTLESTWNGCSGLSGSIPDISGLTSLTTIAYAWYGCTGLTGSLPDISALTSLTTINSAWANCTSLDANTRTVADIFGAGPFPALTDSRNCFSNVDGLIGNGSDFTGLGKSGSYTVGSTSGDSSYRTFFGCTGLTDYGALGPNWT